MKIIHKYIAKNFLVTFFVVFLFTILLFVLSDFFSKLGVILKSSVPLKYVIEYYFYYIPFVVYFSLPFIYGLSSVISLGYLSFRNEIIVMRSSGLSIFRISLPVIILSFVVAFVMFVGKERVVNYGLDRASYIKKYVFQKKSNNSIWLKVGNYFIEAKGVVLNKRELIDVTCYKIDKGFSDIKIILKAKTGIFTKDKLVLNNVIRTTMPFKTKESIRHVSIATNKPFISLLSRSKFREPSLRELFSGYRFGKDKDYFLSLILSRFLYPFSCFILTLISLVFILRITPRKSGFIGNVFFGGVVFLIYIVSFEMIKTMGGYSMVNPWIAMFIFMLFWIAISLYNLMKLGI